MRALGYRRAPDGGPRDRDARHHLGAAPVPSTSDLRQLFGPALDQGGLSSCVANAISDAVRAVQVRLGADPGKTPLLSRLALYWLARAEAGEQDMDAGSFIHLAFESLNTFGFAPEPVWPYTDAGEKWKHKPPLHALEAAFDQRDDKRPDVDYLRILTSGGALVDDIKRALGAGMPVVFGVDVTNSFCSGELGKTGIAQAPLWDDEIAGGHAMLIGGHAPGYAWSRTSWGDGAFDHGWFKISWDYLETSTDTWLIASAPLYSEASL
jgi:hypothetical protein